MYQFFFSKNVFSTLIMRFLAKKIRNFLMLEKNRKHYGVNLKKNFIYLKAFFTSLKNGEGKKYAGGSR